MFNKLIIFVDYKGREFIKGIETIMKREKQNVVFVQQNSSK